MELTTRQWNLYNYLKENTDIYLTKEQIVANVDGYIAAAFYFLLFCLKLL